MEERKRSEERGERKDGKREEKTCPFFPLPSIAPL